MTVLPNGDIQLKIKIMNNIIHIHKLRNAKIKGNLKLILYLVVIHQIFMQLYTNTQTYNYKEKGKII